MRRDELSQAEMPVFLIPVGEIEVPADRLRSLKLEQADAIGAAILADGQYDPITVAKLPGREQFTLVDGLHRLEGCRQHGIELIEARIGSADREARLRQEVLSAWARADHDVFDRAAQIQAMVNAAAVPPGSDDATAVAMIATALRWDLAAAETLGLSPRSVRNYCGVGKAFSPAQVEVLRARQMAGELVPLMRLAALPPEDFARAWMAIEAGDVASIAEALALVALAPVQAFDKKRAKLVKQAGTWPAHEIRHLIDELRRLYAEKTAPEARG